MAWTVNYLDCEDKRRGVPAHSLDDAVTLASGLLCEGFIVENIRADIGLVMSSLEVKQLCTAYAFASVPV